MRRSRLSHSDLGGYSGAEKEGKLRIPKTVVHTLNARGNIMLDVTRDYFGMSSQRMHREIQAMVATTSATLLRKGIHYAHLKHALIPQISRKEMALIFDSTRVDGSNYAIPAHERLFTLLDRSGSRAILSGDYLDHGLPQADLHAILLRSLVQAAEVNFRHSDLIFVIYVNNLSETMVKSIDAGFKGMRGYLGYVDTTYASAFKLLLSASLPNDYIQHRHIIIGPQEDDRPASDNVNLLGFPFEEAGFTLRSVPSWMQGTLLSYKIERPTALGETDMEFSINSVTAEPARLDQFEVVVDDRRFAYLRREKAESLRRLGLLRRDATALSALIADRINQNYLYSMTYDDEHDVVRFNTILQVDDVDGRPFRVLVGLSYRPKEKKLFLLTLF